MQIQFKTKNDKQLQAVEYWIDTVTEQMLYGGSKGSGKSFLGCSLIFGDALIYPETHYFIARAELTDLRKFTIPSIHEVFKNWGLKLEDYATFNGQDNCYTLTNGSKVFLLACKEIPSDPLFERFGSMQMTRGWIEEGGEVAENAKSNLWLSIGRWKNEEYKLKKKLLITCNPKKGWMKREFVDPYKIGSLQPSKQFIQALPTDNKYLSQDYIKTLSEEKDPIRRQRLFLGNWDYDDTKDNLVSDDALTDLFSNTITKDNHRYMSVDVARKGNDSTVVSLWDGLELYKISKYQKQDTAMTAQKIKDVASIEKIPFSNIIVDEDGVGGGVVDNLFGVKGFVANSSPMLTANQIRLKMAQLPDAPRTNFANLKTQCGFKLAELINEHKMSCKVFEMRTELMEDVSSILRQKNPDSDGKLQLRSKEEVKEELGRSPDVGDTLLMRAYFELKKEADPNYGTNQEHVINLQRERFTHNRNNMSSNSAK